ncbi:helix-turn-helix domain-containing protein [Streptomyces sp. NPDC056069]|uniref:helix-turn-helix domain-containing protein n=1 Tax=Streptomyces sp. NPDC056069 TaxID=3345702 RepID=UPI0035E38C80
MPQPASGLVHRNVHHATHYTVVGNHLAQHRELTLVARGLALLLQSLPAGSAVGVKAIAAQVPESELRVARAMRELEAHGYLLRTRERLPDGRIAPRTFSYNRPGADPTPTRATPERTSGRQPGRVSAPARPGETPEADPGPGPDPGPAVDLVPDPEPEPGPGPDRDPAVDLVPDPEPDPDQDPEPDPGGAAAPPPAKPPTAFRPPPPARHGPPAPPAPALPAPLPEHHGPAAALLAGLRLHSPRLLLAERDIRRLAPAVTTWLARGAHPDAVVRTLCACLPDDLVHPAGLLAHRLVALLPPPLPARPPAPASRAICPGCERPFRSTSAGPGHCRDCRPVTREAA